MPADRKRIVIEYGRMWPREVFDIAEERKLVKETLRSPGVYVLYRDERPYYIGKATKALFNRLHDHASKSTDKYFNLWNYFSAFVVDREHIADVEGILIAAMPTANSAAPKIKQIAVPAKLRKKMREARQRWFE
jgi:hypothetical protein